MDSQATADYLHRPEGTLRSWRYQGEGPPYIRVGSKILYRRGDVDAWLDGNRVVPQGAA